MTLPHVYEYSLKYIRKIVSYMIKLLNTTLKVKNFETPAYYRMDFKRTLSLEQINSSSDSDYQNIEEFVWIMTVAIHKN